MSAAGMDPRLDRRIGSPEGLARRVAELERQMRQITAMQADHVGTYVPSFNISGVGPLATTGPPNSTSGTAFSTPIEGRYLCGNYGTAFKTGAAGMGGFSYYIDGTYKANIEHYHNEISSHRVLMPRWDFIDFAAGTHYHWINTTAGVSSDSNDKWWFVGFRVGAL